MYMLSDDELPRLMADVKFDRLHVVRMRARELLQFIKMLRNVLPALVVVGTAKENIARTKLSSPKLSEVKCNFLVWAFKHKCHAIVAPFFLTRYFCINLHINIVV